MTPEHKWSSVHNSTLVTTPYLSESCHCKEALISPNSVSSPLTFSPTMALAFAGKAVAASAISAIARKSFEYLEKCINAEGIQSVKKRLERTLPQVQVVFDAVDVEWIRGQSEALDAWLWQLRDAVEEAEDALDEVEYYKLEKKVKSRGGKVSKSLYNCKQMFVQQFSTTFKVGTFKRVVDAMKKLDEVAAGVERFILLVDRLDSCSSGLMCHQEIIGNPHETSSFLVDERIIGRDMERDQIVEWLINLESNDHDLGDCNVATFAIVGIGGMGKTSLAQTVYLDQRVKRCFDQSIWVCVSNDFNVHTLTRKILQETTMGGTDVTSLNTLQEILKQKLSSEKFLLILDDVWNDETSADWEKLLAPLKFGQKGSKILLTTRMQSVVDAVKRVLGGGTKSLKLEGLQENDLLKLLNKHAFVGVNPDDYINLQEIGKQIAKKLSGSPLAAKVMGGLLNNSMDTISWNRILRENISTIEHGSGDVMGVLSLSYRHLPPYLQACFRYCSLFQEDYSFRKDELVNLWMGSGLIQPSVYECQRLEDVGEYYLGILTRKSFFELRSDESKNLYEGIRNAGEYCGEYYVMHDLLHELARTVSRKECIYISSNNFGNVPLTVRHLQICKVNCSWIIDFSKLKKLRTLIISFERTVDERDQLNMLRKVLKVTTKLRVLRVHTQLPPSIGSKLPFDNLIHLRNLSFESSYLKDPYPPCIYKLYHLQIIESSCLWDSCQLNNMVNLRHLYYSGTQNGPPYIGDFTCLQGLHVSLKYGKISELKELKDLRYLYIDDIQTNNVEEAKQAKLEEKGNLIELSLSWYHRQLESATAEKYLDNLQPHRNLSKLKINGYSGSRSPFWMDNPVISNLTYVSIDHCVKLQNLPSLGSLPSLKYLHLTDMPAVKRIDKSFYGREEPFGFPSLKLLSIQMFPALEEWDEMEDMNMFPQLKTLFIIACKALQNVPALPSTIACLEIQNTGLTNLPAIYQPNVPAPKSSLSKLMISHCPNLVTLKEEHYFLGLDKLFISDCENMLYFPMHLLQTLPFLKTFWVANCPKLIGSQEDIGLPSCIRKLYIGSCSVYETFLVNSLCSLTSLTTLRLHNCVMTGLPSAKVLRNLRTVQHLEIVHCRELDALDGIEELTYLKELNIHGCDKLDEHLGILSQQMLQASDFSQGTTVCSSHFRKLEKLRIGNPFFLQWKSLRRVDSVRYLTIDNSHNCLPEEWLMQNRNNLVCLGVLNSTHLEFLPSIMASLTSLEILELHGATLLQSLPELPASLEFLQIEECHPLLERRCQKRSGRDRHKIARIRNVKIARDRLMLCAWSSYTGSI